MEVHTNTKIRINMEWVAVERFFNEVEYGNRFWGEDNIQTDWTPIQIVKTMIRNLEEAGRKPDGYN